MHVYNITSYFMWIIIHFMLGTYFVENADLEKLPVLEVNVCICNDVREFGIVHMLFFLSVRIVICSS